jgi:hypothetical protein
LESIERLKHYLWHGILRVQDQEAPNLEHLKYYWQYGIFRVEDDGVPKPRASKTVPVERY